MRHTYLLDEGRITGPEEDKEFLEQERLMPSQDLISSQDLDDIAFLASERGQNLAIALQEAMGTALTTFNKGFNYPQYINICRIAWGKFFFYKGRN